MNILYINAMGPKEKTPQGGIFVTQRIKALRQLGVNIYPYNYDVCYPKWVRKLLKIPDHGELLDYQDGIHYQVSRIRYNAFEVLLSKIYVNTIIPKLIKKMSTDFDHITDIDLIHLHWVWPIGLGVLEYSKKTGIPYVLTCHGSEINYSLNDAILKKPILDIMEKASAVEFVSGALMKTAMESGYSGKNGYVVNNGIDASVFKRLTDSNKKKLIGFVGNLIMVKGVDRLPDIFRGIYEFDHEIKFVIAGSGPEQADLEQKMADLPVQFTGLLSQEELVRIYNDMMLIIVPSRYEGYGCVINEAQACDVIPIAMDVGGIPEAVNKYGFLIQNTDEDRIKQDFISTAIEVIKNEKIIPIESLREFTNQLSWVERSRLSINIYERVLRKR